MPIFNLLSALLTTIIIESLAAYIMGYRGRNTFIILALINIITNPLLNYILMIIYSLKLYNIYSAAVVFLEATVVIIEWRLLVFSLGRSSKSMFLLSLVMNITSFLAGLLIFR